MPGRRDRGGNPGAAVLDQDARGGAPPHEGGPGPRRDIAERQGRRVAGPLPVPPQPGSRAERRAQRLRRRQRPGGGSGAPPRRTGGTTRRAGASSRRRAPAGAEHLSHPDRGAAPRGGGGDGGRTPAHRLALGGARAAGPRRLARPARGRAHRRHGPARPHCRRRARSGSVRADGLPRAAALGRRGRRGRRTRDACDDHLGRHRPRRRYGRRRPPSPHHRNRCGRHRRSAPDHGRDRRGAR